MLYVVALLLSVVIAAFVATPLLAGASSDDGSPLKDGLKAGGLTKAERTGYGARLLDAPAASERPAHPVLALWIVAALALAGPVYWTLGSPSAADMPLETRADSGTLPALIARIERRLAQRPGDVTGWSVIAPVYATLGRHEDAVAAFTTQVRLAGPNADALLGRAASLEALGRTVAAERDRTVAAELNQGALRASPAIQSMVDGLAARLEADPNDLDGWTRLIRSYHVLGREAEAAAALDAASAAFPDAASRAQLRAAGEEPVR